MLKTQKCVKEMMEALDLPLPNEDRPGLVGLKLDLLRNLVSEEAIEFDVAMSVLQALREPDRLVRATVTTEIAKREEEKGEGGDEAVVARFRAMSDVEFYQAATIYWWAEVIDAICDITFVIHNCSNAMGVDIEPFFDEVWQANMRKANGPLREDGKRLKPPGWQPPRIEEMLRKLLATGKASLEEPWTSPEDWGAR